MVSSLSLIFQSPFGILDIENCFPQKLQLKVFAKSIQNSPAVPQFGQ